MNTGRISFAEPHNRPQTYRSPPPQIDDHFSGLRSALPSAQSSLTNVSLAPPTTFQQLTMLLPKPPEPGSSSSSTLTVSPGGFTLEQKLLQQKCTAEAKRLLAPIVTTSLQKAKKYLLELRENPRIQKSRQRVAAVELYELLEPIDLESLSETEPEQYQQLLIYLENHKNLSQPSVSRIRNLKKHKLKFIEAQNLQQILTKYLENFVSALATCKVITYLPDLLKIGDIFLEEHQQERKFNLYEQAINVFSVLLISYTQALKQNKITPLNYEEAIQSLKLFKKQTKEVYLDHLPRPATILSTEYWINITYLLSCYIIKYIALYIDKPLIIWPSLRKVLQTLLKDAVYIRKINEEIYERSLIKISPNKEAMLKQIDPQTRRTIHEILKELPEEPPSEHATPVQTPIVAPVVPPPLREPSPTTAPMTSVSATQEVLTSRTPVNEPVDSLKSLAKSIAEVLGNILQERLGDIVKDSLQKAKSDFFNVKKFLEDQQISLESIPAHELERLGKILSQILANPALRHGARHRISYLQTALEHKKAVLISKQQRLEASLYALLDQKLRNSTLPYIAILGGLLNIFSIYKQKHAPEGQAVRQVNYKQTDNDYELFLTLLKSFTEIPLSREGISPDSLLENMENLTNILFDEYLPRLPIEKIPGSGRCIYKHLLLAYALKSLVAYMPRSSARPLLSWQEILTKLLNDQTYLKHMVEEIHNKVSGRLCLMSSSQEITFILADILKQLNNLLASLNTAQSVIL